jgi:hypothetical protein
MDTANTAERLAAKLTQELNRIVGDRGKVIHVVTEGLGHGWCVVFDTEHAALKAYHTYRYSKGITFGESKNLNGWYISTEPTV